MSYSTAQIGPSPINGHVDPAPTRPIEITPISVQVKKGLSDLEGVRHCGTLVDETTLVVQVTGGDLVDIVIELRRIVGEHQVVDFHHSP